ncbi:MAG: hypothetical protein IT373_31600 [Polyangiaceae bacterium]|nr:hypothetical protein [Polyangiaceae bacterium]
MKTAFIFTTSITLVAAVAAVQGCKKDETTNNTTTTTTTSTTTTGTGGSGGTGPTCAEYCQAAVDICGASQGTKQFEDTTACEDVCAFWDPGTPGAQSGDSLACRDSHVTLAATDAAAHCPHAGPAGGGICGTSQCDAFCALDLAVCTGVDAAFASLSECTTACALWAGADADYASNPTDTTDSFGCRLYHLIAAAGDPTTHCSHTGDASPICVN